jgi:HTH-type transcriptional regulator / antitoxin HipB
MNTAMATANVKKRARLVQPQLDELLNTPERRAAFEDASAALEAGRLVRALRERAGLTQTELAAKLGVKQPRVSAIEAGAGRDGPSYALLRRIAIACGVEWVPYRLFVRGRAVAAAAAETSA